MVMSDADFQEIELRVILRKLEPVPPVVIEQIVPDVVVLEPQPVEDKIVYIPKAKEEIELVVLAPIVIPEMDDEDLDEDEELEMDPEEPD